MNYIEFKIHDDDGYERLKAVVEKLQMEKEQGTLNPSAERWKILFGEEALKNFWWPTKAEFEAYQQLYFSIPAAERAVHPSLQTPWDFESMIDAIKNGDYQLTGCTRQGDSTARLGFRPFGHPYGGSESLQELVKCFGHEILEVHDA
jgi:hypothetical protein